MSWPQWIYVLLSAYGVFIIIARHGTTGRHNAPADLFGSVVCWWLLYMGGFFRGGA